MSIVGREECQDLCDQIATCAAYTIGIDGRNCQLASTCMGTSRVAGLRTYFKPSVRAPQMPAKEDRAAAAAADDGSLQQHKSGPQSPRASAGRNGAAHGWQGSRGSRSRKESEAAAAPQADCAYCTPPGPCEAPKLCRSGICFSGGPLPEEAPCPGGVCQRGVCVYRAGAGLHLPHKGRSVLEANSGGAAQADDHGTDDSSDRDRRGLDGVNSPLDSFRLLRGHTCTPEMTVIGISSNLRACAAKCLSEATCSAFSLRLDELKQCVLFGAAADCTAEDASFLTGIKEAGEAQVA